MIDLPDPFILRPMTKSDLEAVAAIDREAKPSPWSRAGFEAELTHPVSYPLVLTAREQILGYVIPWFVAGEGQIQTIAVHQEWRGHGFGELLLLQAISRGIELGVDKIMLEVRQSNLAARALYRKYGFALVGERPRYYRHNGETALLLNLEIDPSAYGPKLEEHRVSLINRLKTVADLISPR